MLDSENGKKDTNWSFSNLESPTREVLRIPVPIVRVIAGSSLWEKFMESSAGANVYRQAHGQPKGTFPQPSLYLGQASCSTRSPTLQWQVLRPLPSPHQAQVRGRVLWKLDSHPLIYFYNTFGAPELFPEYLTYILFFEGRILLLVFYNHSYSQFLCADFFRSIVQVQNLYMSPSIASYLFWMWILHFMSLLFFYALLVCHS